MALTLNVKVSLCACRASGERVGGAVSKVDVSDAQSVRPLSAASLTSVRRPDLHAVLQPSIQDVITVDLDLKGDRVFLLSIQVLEALCDDDGWKTPDDVRDGITSQQQRDVISMLLFLLI